MNKTGGKPKYYLTAWGEEKSIYDWWQDPRVSLSTQNIRNRYYNYLEDLENEVEKPRYHSVEDLLTAAFRKRNGHRPKPRGKDRQRITDWTAQVFQPLQAFLQEMPGEIS